MYVKSVTLEGFKSYGKRQEIKGFDPEFNAITGLNGSGKSNILDAICFVLGITNLTHVRATSLQDLVYKNGQAGITKASVTIVFDNSDTKNGPIGYEQYREISVTRQVVMGGKNKYLINGVNCQNKKVQDLFCSVQLNVNNPHFLIMQGRITKVLNMKPMEILSMIEEAAGTRMYETKKQVAQKTIEKKEAKLKELNEVINEEITPKIEKLKEEQKQYMEYQRMSRELERMTKLHTAWLYNRFLDDLNGTDGELEKNKNKVEEIKVEISEGKEEMKKIDVTIEELLKSKEQASGAQLKDTESQLKELEKHEAKAQAQVKTIGESLKSEEKRKKQLEKNLKDEENVLASRIKEQSKMEDVFNKLREADEKASADLEKARERYQAVSTGLLTNADGEASTLQEQLIVAKQEVSQAETEKKQSEMKLTQLQKEMKEKQQDMQRTQKDYHKDESLFLSKQKDVEALNKALKNVGIAEGEEESLQEQCRTLSADVRKLHNQVATFEDRNPALVFKYRDPETNFDRSSVKGLICMNLKVKNTVHARALQVAGGGRLFNVVVDNERTSKKILERGNLQTRTTIIPLNKISGRSIPNPVVSLAQQLVGKENVQPALSLIDYDPELQPAMEFVFGQTFICKDMDVAKKVTFHPKIMKKSVTLDGDVMDPSGTLSGGAADKSDPILLTVARLAQDREELRVKSEELAKLETRWKSLSRAAEKYRDLKQKMEIATHELEMVRRKLEQTTHHQYKEEVEKLTAEIAELKETVQRCQKVKSEGSKKVAELENKVKNAKSIKDQELKRAEEDMKKLSKKAEDCKAQWQKREQECESLELEIKELQTSIENNKANMITVGKEIEEQIAKQAELKADFDTVKEQAQIMRNELKALKEEISQKNKEINNANHRKEQIKKDNEDRDLEIKKMIHEATKIETRKEELSHSVAVLESKYDWVSRDKKFFGAKGGAYDYTGMDMGNMGKNIQNLEAQHKEMSRTINTRAMNMLGKEEEQYAELMRKKKVVENDKMKIVEVIKELDEKKNVALRKAWQQVNKDFGSIFSSLLPGANARLNPPPGRDVLEGLEIGVGFGDTWKESLGELSGGQRSLVALSLILAMLLFSPAPIYILDEVDAALDLSHTQNIGNMLKKHFKHSQFIIVSLKDGMFNNANVLFRTQFIDGMSTVTRHTQFGR